MEELLVLLHYSFDVSMFYYSLKVTGNVYFTRTVEPF